MRSAELSFLGLHGDLLTGVRRAASSAVQRAWHSLFGLSDIQAATELGQRDPTRHPRALACLF
jgi:hypothetical protein